MTTKAKWMVEGTIEEAKEIVSEAIRSHKTGCAIAVGAAIVGAGLFGCYKKIKKMKIDLCISESYACELEDEIADLEEKLHQAQASNSVEAFCKTLNETAKEIAKLTKDRTCC